MHHIRQQALLIASALLGVGLLAACGGGGGASPASSSSLVPANNQNPSLATASVTFSIPRPSAGALTSSTLRRPKFISPATNNLSIFIDGAEAFSQVQVPYNATTGTGVPTPNPTNPTFTGSNGTTATLTGTETAADFTWTLTLTTVPGNHTVGVALLGDSSTPHDVLSEGQATVNMAPGSSSTASLLLQGVVGSAYLTCPASFFSSSLWVPSTDNGTCGNYSNFTPGATPGSGGTYDFTVVAADTNGFPIPQQYESDGTTPLPFDNASATYPLRIEESPSDSPQILTITAGSPGSLSFYEPGTALNDGPSGSWYLLQATALTYGQDVHIQCNQVGIGNVVVTLARSTPTTSLDGFDSTQMTTDNVTYPYPPGGQLPIGYQNAYNTHYGSHTDLNFVPNVSVNCTSSLTMTVQ